MPINKKQTRCGVTGACGWLGVAHSANLSAMTDIDSSTRGTAGPDGSENAGAPELGELAATLGIQVVSATPSLVVATMPVAGNTQPHGVLHGGATIALAETAASLAASLHASELSRQATPSGPGKIAVGIEVSASHHRSATSGTVTATATAIHLGRTTASYDVGVVDVAGRRISTARVTCMVLDVRRATAEADPATTPTTESSAVDAA